MKYRILNIVVQSIAVLTIFGPYVAVRFIGPAWAVKFVLIVLGTTTLTLGTILFGVNGHLEEKWPENASLVKKYGKRRVVWVVRVFALSVGLFLFLYGTIPETRDVIAVTQGEAPLMRVGRILEMHYTTLGWFISRSVTLDENSDQSGTSFTTLYFPIRYIEVGNTYEFLYLPNTHYILEA